MPHEDKDQQQQLQPIPSHIPTVTTRKPLTINALIEGLERDIQPSPQFPSAMAAAETPQPGTRAFRGMDIEAVTTALNQGAPTRIQRFFKAVSEIIIEPIAENVTGSLADIFRVSPPLARGAEFLAARGVPVPAFATPTTRPEEVMQARKAVALDAAFTLGGLGLSRLGSASFVRAGGYKATTSFLENLGARLPSAAVEAAGVGALPIFTRGTPQERLRAAGEFGLFGAALAPAGPAVAAVGRRFKLTPQKMVKEIREALRILTPAQIERSTFPRVLDRLSNSAGVFDKLLDDIGRIADGKLARQVSDRASVSLDPLTSSQANIVRGNFVRQELSRISPELKSALEEELLMVRSVTQELARPLRGRPAEAIVGAGKLRQAGLTKAREATADIVEAATAQVEERLAQRATLGLDPLTKAQENFLRQQTTTRLLRQVPATFSQESAKTLASEANRMLALVSQSNLRGLNDLVGLQRHLDSFLKRAVLTETAFRVPSPLTTFRAAFSTLGKTVSGRPLAEGEGLRPVVITARNFLFGYASFLFDSVGNALRVGTEVGKAPVLDSIDILMGTVKTPFLRTRAIGQAAIETTRAGTANILEFGIRPGGERGFLRLAGSRFITKLNETEKIAVRELLQIEDQLVTKGATRDLLDRGTVVRQRLASAIRKQERGLSDAEIGETIERMKNQFTRGIEGAVGTRPGATITLFNGGDTPWWTPNPTRAAGFGTVRRIKVPIAAYRAGQLEARRLGSGTAGDSVLSSSLTKKAESVKATADVLDLQTGFVKRGTVGAAQVRTGKIILFKDRQLWMARFEGGNLEASVRKDMGGSNIISTDLFASTPEHALKKTRQLYPESTVEITIEGEAPFIRGGTVGAAQITSVPATKQRGNFLASIVNRLRNRNLATEFATSQIRPFFVAGEAIGEEGALSLPMRALDIVAFTPLRFKAIADTAARRFGARMFLWQRALESAKAAGKSGIEREAFLREWFNNIPGATQQQALTFANRMAFIAPSGPQRTRGFDNLFVQLFISPFARFGTAWAGFLAELLPVVGFANRPLREAIVTGRISQSTITEAVVTQIGGAGILNLVDETLYDRVDFNPTRGPIYREGNREVALNAPGFADALMLTAVARGDFQNAAAALPFTGLVFMGGGLLSQAAKIFLDPTQNTAENSATALEEIMMLLVPGKHALRMLNEGLAGGREEPGLPGGGVAIGRTLVPGQRALLGVSREGVNVLPETLLRVREGGGKEPATGKLIGTDLTVPRSLSSVLTARELNDAERALNLVRQRTGRDFRVLQINNVKLPISANPDLTVGQTDPLVINFFQQAKADYLASIMSDLWNQEVFQRAAPGMLELTLEAHSQAALEHAKQKTLQEFGARLLPDGKLSPARTAR